MSRRSAGPVERVCLGLFASGLVALCACTPLDDPNDQLRPRGVSSCNHRLVDTQTDEENCGECGVSCPGAGAACGMPEQCVAGGCVCPGSPPGCAPGFADCGAGCVDLSSTKASCGECGNACADDPLCPVPIVCMGGGCVCPGAAPICPPGWMLCGEVCVDPATDAANCGDCNNACVDDGVFCNGTAACVDGGCTQLAEPCGAQGCDEATHACGSCSAPEFPCPDDGSFCDAFFACESGSCVAHPRRCEDPASPFCDAASESCVACVDDAGCDALDDGLLCNGITSCVAGACVTNSDPCGDELCSEGAGCHQCDVDADCNPGRCEPSLLFCVECLDNRDCAADLVCDTSANRCVLP